MTLDAQWVVGFVDGEGCFHVGIATHAEMSSGVQVLPEFVVVQHARDVKVLHAIKQFFGCGVVRKNHDDRMCFRVRRIEHLVERIVPFFEAHDLKTLKRQDFIAFRKAIRLVSAKKHLTPEGLEQIRGIAAGMNRRRNRKAGKVKSSSP